jgi:hypothetical protein
MPEDKGGDGNGVDRDQTRQADSFMFGTSDTKVDMGFERYLKCLWWARLG